jgi:hypothetical protein
VESTGAKVAELSVKRVFSPRRRVVVIGVVALAGGAVAGGVAVAAGGGAGPASPGGGGAIATTAVVRTDLASTVQVGGSIGYGGSYTVTAPSGTSASQVSQQQQAVTGDRQQLAAARKTESDASAADDQAISADETNVGTAQSALTADETKQKKACAGSGTTSQACSQDTQQVAADKTALTQARQQLAQARSAATTDHDQNQAAVTADQSKLADDAATLASLQADAVNPGTTFTWLPQPGQVIREDQKVYSVSNVPVPLLYGPVPAYRPMYAGMSDGPDVAELTRDLIRLGFGAGLAHGDHFSSATAAAVDQWQKALGLPATGQILLGEVVFEPSAIRVTAVTPSPGSAVGGGGGGGGTAGSGGGGGGATVLTATGTVPVVSVDLGVSQEYLVKPGDGVSVVLPDGTTTVAGKVESVGSVATCSGGGSTGTGNGGAGGGGSSPCSQAGSGGSAGTNSSPTVPVTITLDRANAAADFDQAPVNVNITAQRADNVLAVPVNALLALQGGGYGMEVVTGSKTRLVGVTTGMYAGSMVQVSGPGITAGTRVQVPAQ